jgi:8-oxo-dGTP pyrophosphatase MutT (NUDIX family)
MFLRIERRPAAVLIPVIAREPEATVLLTVRTAEMRSHAGEIAFPGGRIDAEDAQSGNRGLAGSGGRDRVVARVR